MCVPEVDCDVLSGLFVELELLNWVVSNLNQGFSWPWHEPNNSCVVYKSRVHSSIVSKIVSSLWHQEHDVEVVLNSSVKLIHQHFIFDFLGIFCAGIWVSHHPGDNFLHLFLDCRKVLLAEQVGDLSDSQNSVDILHKSLLSYLIVWKHEDCGAVIFKGALLWPLFNFLSEVFQLKALWSCDLT